MTERKGIRNWPIWAKITLGVTVALLIITAAIAIRYAAAFNGFLDKITDWGKETKQYSVLVMTDSNIQGLSSLTGKGIGFLNTDPEATIAEQYLQQEVKFEAGFYDDINILSEVLNSGIVSAITLETSRLDALQDEANELHALTSQTRALYTFEITFSTDDSQNTASTNKQITKDPFIVYISGTDSRAGVKATARSDVNIVAVVNPGQGKILLVSIPRDTYVKLHGTTGLNDKLTHAGVYGIDMSKSTIEDFLNIDIDHTIKVSFDTVTKLVDELDGIEINSDRAMRLKAEGKDKYCNFVEGWQHIDGDCALRFARERKSYETGDRHRGENQQQVITSIIGKLSESRSHLLKLPSILEIAADSFETDFQKDQIMEFIRMQLGQNIKWQVESIAIDGTGSYEPTYSMGANLPLYVMIPSSSSITEAMSKINQYLNH